jgi:hypothetical protein
MIVMASIVAESKLFWYSQHYRALDHTGQGVLLSEADRLKGAQIYQTSWNMADVFVIRGLVNGTAGTITVDEFLNRAGMTDFLVLPADFSHPALVRVAVKGHYGLFQRR